LYFLHGDHSPGKPGKVREFQSGQGKIRENAKKSGKTVKKTLMKVETLGIFALYGLYFTFFENFRSLRLRIILHLLQQQPQFIK